MQNQQKNSIVGRAAHFALATGLQVAVFDMHARDFVPGAACGFCESCELARQQKCHHIHTHLYGSFEAERWNNLYIYYCPMGLAFASTLVYEGATPAYSMVSGPIVLGSVADVLADNGGCMPAEVAGLPQRSPAEMTALAQTQWAVSMFLSGRQAEQAEVADRVQFDILNTMYDITTSVAQNPTGRYPVEIEQKLQRMIVQGDKQGAQELINQLLGHLYFSSPKDFAFIKNRAAELVVLFSRAAIEGGADVQQIFGQNRNILQQISRFETLDELSEFLTAMFYRFVGYVFDFSQIEHTDIVHKTVNYVRAHYSEKITLDDVAGHVYLSKSYLSRIFKEELGSSFTDFVNAVRIQKSKELLKDQSISLANIADLVGFSDQSYFTKVFSRAEGMSPGQYRRRRGKHM